MLAKAHIAVGMAAAFSIVRPETVADALPVITGGVLGCLICDIDCENSRERTDSSHWRIVMGIVAIAFTSHVLLDLMNKKSVRLAYPAKKGFRLGWFYADRLANKFFAFAGSVCLILTVILCMR